jgi:hypothetical protein
MLGVEPLCSDAKTMFGYVRYIKRVIRTGVSQQAWEHLTRQQIMPDQYSITSEGDSQAEPHLARDSYRYAKKQRASGATERPLVLSNVRCAGDVLCNSGTANTWLPPEQQVTDTLMILQAAGCQKWDVQHVRA